MIINTGDIIQMKPYEAASLLGDHPRPCDHCGGVVRLRNIGEPSMPHLLALGCTKCGADFLVINVTAD
jgi:hypothetical protein